jgi:L-ascorbate metabolism protein UlaG (beta-lactamase superfamily)
MPADLASRRSRAKLAGAGRDQRKGEAGMICPPRFWLAALTLCLAGLLAPPSVAQEYEPERCPRFVASAPRVIPANFLMPAQAEQGEVHLTFIGHATFLIESPAGVTIATDYNDGVRPAIVPEIVTMNRAHTTHFTFFPEPEIEHVLHGWGEDGVPARHDLTVRDVWIRNVTTNIRGGFGMSAGIQRDMNSIFVFEVSGLCIAHLGHLHHPLTEEHLKALGRIDVVLAPVDGSMTLNVDDMIGVLDDIQAPLVIPMHFFGQSTLNRFISRLEEHYVVELSDTPGLVLSRGTLPKTPTLLVLPGH